MLASCAIPGYFAPITIEGTEYFDGGVHSRTNADVLTTQPLDTVIVVSSMSAAHGRSIGADSLLRLSVHRRLQREIGRLEATGTSVIRLEPGPASRPRHGLLGHGREPAPRVIEAAYEETRAEDPLQLLTTLHDVAAGCAAG